MFTFQDFSRALRFSFILSTLVTHKLIIFLAIDCKAIVPSAHTLICDHYIPV